jgi:hypothetical protein
VAAVNPVRGFGLAGAAGGTVAAVRAGGSEAKDGALVP